MEAYTLHHGDCLQVMPTFEQDRFDSIVSDPPYGLSFMGKEWDHGVPSVPFWREALRVAKPGAHLIAFGGSRTYHRLAVAIEDAGWEIRDCIMWVYGTGFPKSMNVGKAIDDSLGVEREVIAIRSDSGGRTVPFLYANNSQGHYYEVTTATSDAAKQWDGWGTALKPAWEPIIVARKPFDCTVAENVLKWGVGGMNIEACRVPGNDHAAAWDNKMGKPVAFLDHLKKDGLSETQKTKKVDMSAYRPSGRWPSNVIHDGSEDVLARFPENAPLQSQPKKEDSKVAAAFGDVDPREQDDSAGSAARFFYCAKASREDRDDGCDEMQDSNVGVLNGRKRGTLGNEASGKNYHPTVKPTELMRYLVRLVTPKKGVVLDPFMGSGSTGRGAVLEGFGFVGIEQNAEYIEIARARIGKIANGV